MSVTIVGLIISIAGTVLLKLGFSEACSNEIVSLSPAVVGGIIAWYGRVKQGDVNLFGIRKV